MPLPPEIPDAKVLITVKTYPQPSHKYSELVCTAGILETGEWIRIYPVPFRSLADESQYKKYSWVQLNLVRNTKDFRPESYRPKRAFDEPITPIGAIDPSNNWAGRKAVVLKEVYTSMEALIAEAKGESNKSLATLKPAEIIDLVIEKDDREWKESWLNQLRQFSMFDIDDKGQGQLRDVVKKVPYKFSYKFLTEGDKRPRKLKIEDWEIGALYWKCLSSTQGDEQAANKLVRQKYFDTFTTTKDLYFFLGTTKSFHKRSLNPFMIIGVFYPPITAQLSLF